MSFVEWNGLFDFDEKGNVCGSDVFHDDIAKSNYLYMLCKYNQLYLCGKKLPKFFKMELPLVLESVENGGDFGKALTTVLKNCEQKVQEYAKMTKTPKDLIENVNEGLVELPNFVDFIKSLINTDVVTRQQTEDGQKKALLYELVRVAGKYSAEATKCISNAVMED